MVKEWRNDARGGGPQMVKDAKDGGKGGPSGGESPKQPLEKLQSDVLNTDFSEK